MVYGVYSLEGPPGGIIGDTFAGENREGRNQFYQCYNTLALACYSEG